MSWPLHALPPDLPEMLAASSSTSPSPPSPPPPSSSPPFQWAGLEGQEGMQALGGLEALEGLDRFFANASFVNGSIFNDTFGNHTENPRDINSFYFFQTAQFAVLWALFVLIVLGNSAVLLALAFNKQRKSRMNFFIMQLAFADLLVGLISVPTDLVWRMTVEWHAGNLACKFIRYLQVLVTYSSTYVLVALSIDRYDAITHPMNFSRSGRRSRFLIAGAWTLSCLFAAPILVLFEEREVEGHRQCWIELPERWQWRLYITLVALVVFALPALIISACYTVIVCTIWNKSHGLAGPQRAQRASRSRRGTAGTAGTGISESGGLQRALMPGPLLKRVKRVKRVPSRWGCPSGCPDPAVAHAAGPEATVEESLMADKRKGFRKGRSRSGPRTSFRPLSYAGGSLTSFTSNGPKGDHLEQDSRRASSRGLIPRAKVKTVKMTLVIVLVFVLCWSPYFVLNLLQVYDHLPVTQTNIAVASFVQSLAPLNSAANPLIYCLFSTHICRTLRKVPPFSWMLALREAPAAAVVDNNISGATETVTHIGASPMRSLQRHQVTIRIPRAPAGAISAV